MVFLLLILILMLMMIIIIDEMCLSVKWIGVGSERDAIIIRDV